MGRAVLLSFDGAAEIPIVPYVKTREREAAVPEVLGIPTIPGAPGIPGTPGHPGYPAGAAATWLLDSGSLRVDSNDPPVNFLASGHYSWNNATWTDADRWTRTGNVYSSAGSMQSGIRSVAVSLNDQQGVSREDVLEDLQDMTINFLQEHPNTGFILSIFFSYFRPQHTSNRRSRLCRLHPLHRRIRRLPDNRPRVT